ncbi:MAG: hypothetical protein EOM12_11270 [Verrucomicrobiae bacterium]|nr:hypothetical protein [Verrucomicrobiae bacterium]
MLYHESAEQHFLSDSHRVRSAAEVHSDMFVECVAMQVHHLDLEFYDHFHIPGSYLRTHATHMEKWHKL